MDDAPIKARIVLDVKGKGQAAVSGNGGVGAIGRMAKRAGGIAKTGLQTSALAIIAAAVIDSLRKDDKEKEEIKKAIDKINEDQSNFFKNLFGLGAGEELDDVAGGVSWSDLSMEEQAALVGVSSNQGFINMQGQWSTTGDMEEDQKQKEAMDSLRDSMNILPKSFEDFQEAIDYFGFKAEEGINLVITDGKSAGGGSGGGSSSSNSDSNSPYTRGPGMQHIIIDTSKLPTADDLKKKAEQQGFPMDEFLVNIPPDMRPDGLL